MKTIQEATRLHDTLVDQLASLPDRNVFGQSNAKEKKIITAYVASLKEVMAGKPANNSDIESWITGDDIAFMSDFL